LPGSRKKGVTYPRRRVTPDRKVYRDNEEYFLLCERLRKAIDDLPLETFEDLGTFRSAVEKLMGEEKRSREG
jgi:hypothetical protein